MGGRGEGGGLPGQKTVLRKALKGTVSVMFIIREICVGGEVDLAYTGQNAYCNTQGKGLWSLTESSQHRVFCLLKMLIIYQTQNV